MSYSQKCESEFLEGDLSLRLTCGSYPYVDPCKERVGNKEPQCKLSGAFHDRLTGFSKSHLRKLQLLMEESRTELSMIRNSVTAVVGFGPRNSQHVYDFLQFFILSGASLDSLFQGLLGGSIQ